MSLAWNFPCLWSEVLSRVHGTQYTVYSAQCTVHSTQYTVHSTEYTVQSLSNRDGNEKGNVTKQVLMSKTTALPVRSGTFLQHSLQNNNVETAVLKYYGEREHARCIVFFCLNLTAASLLINSATSGKLNINLSRSRLKRVNVFFEMTFTLTLPSGSL